MPATDAGSRTETLFGLDALLTDGQRAWRAKAAAAASTIQTTIDGDFEHATFRREYIPVLAEAGLLGMNLTEDAVSYGLACYELEAVDSSWRTFVSVQGSLAMSAIDKFGSDEQRERWLPAMRAGTAIGCFALTEPAGGSDPGAMSTSARRDGGDWILDGAKRWIGLASIADVAVVWARTDEGVRGFLVETSTPGFTATDITTKLSLRASIQCDVQLDGVRVPESARLPGATGLSAPFSCLTEARFGIVFGVMGAAGRAWMPRSNARPRARCSAARSAASSSCSSASPTPSWSTRRACCSPCTLARSSPRARSPQNR